jgi:hypothetical protein
MARKAETNSARYFSLLKAALTGVSQKKIRTYFGGKITNTHISFTLISCLIYNCTLTNLYTVGVLPGTCLTSGGYHKKVAAAFLFTVS